MRLVTYTTGEAHRLGAVVESKVVDLHAVDPGLPETMLGLIAADPAMLEQAKAAAGRSATKSR